MTLVEDVLRLQRKCSELEEAADRREKRLTLLEEQVNGERGISAALKDNTRALESFRRAAYWVIGVIIVGVVGFAFLAIRLAAGVPT